MIDTFSTPDGNCCYGNNGDMYIYGTPQVVAMSLNLAMKACFTQSTTISEHTTINNTENVPPNDTQITYV